MVRRGARNLRRRITSYGPLLAMLLFLASAAVFAQNPSAPDAVPPPKAAPESSSVPSPAQAPAVEYGPAPAVAPQKNVFLVKYVSDGAIYLDGGRNAGLEEGMVLHLVHADPNGGTTD